jgi:M6 family metalloprotease-like protein
VSAAVTNGTTRGLLVRLTLAALAGAPGLSGAQPVPRAPSDIAAPTRAARATAALPSIEGRLRYVVVLCRFQDDAEAGLPAPSAYEPTIGMTYPGIGAYLREASYGAVDFSGSTVVARWYPLPQPRAYYHPNGVLTSAPDLALLARECTAAAESDVTFTAYDGIVLQFSARNAGAFGGTGWTLTLNGKTAPYRVAWILSANSNQSPALYAHEILHSLGLPHSQPDRSRWDVMGTGQGRVGNPVTVIPPHTIAPYRDALGWIPPERKFVPALPSSQSIHLESAAAPTPGTGYWMVAAPLGNAAGDVYTAEARRGFGFDVHLPGEAVLIYRAAAGAEAVNVVADPAADPYTTGAMWMPGMSFSDSLAGVTIRVDAKTTTGYQVTVRRGWSLDVAVQGQGTVTTAAGDVACSVTCAKTYASRGVAVALTATPAAGWRFDRWQGACASSAGTACTLTLGADRALTAVFERATAQQVLTVASVTPATPPSVRPSAASRVSYTIVVRDQTGAGIPDATILVTDPLKTPSRQSLQTDGSGQATYAVAVPAGTASHSYDVTFQAAKFGYGTSAAVTRSLVVEAAAQLAVAPATLAFAGAHLGPQPAAQSVAVTVNAGTPLSDLGATVTYVSGRAGWLAPPALGTTTPAALVVRPTAASTATAGTFEADVCVTSAVAANGPQCVRVTYTVQRPALAASAVFEHLLGAGGLTGEQLQYLDRLGNGNGRLDVGDVRAWLIDTRQIAVGATNAAAVRELRARAVLAARTTGARLP